MAVYKVDTEYVESIIPKLRTIKDYCNEKAGVTAPVADNNAGNVYNEVQTLLKNLNTSWNNLSDLVEKTIGFLTASKNTVDENDSILQVDPATGIAMPRRTGVDVTLDGQNTNYTCGSASGKMILDSMGISVSEEEFWNYANSGGQGTYVFRVTQTINHFAGSSVYKYTNTRNMGLDEYYNLFRKSLENGHPVEVVASIPAGTAFGYSTGGHYFVVNSVYKNDAGEYMAEITDPFSAQWRSNGHQGQKLEMKLSEIKQYNANHSGYVISG